jgi:hypothetical protein
MGGMERAEIKRIDDYLKDPEESLVCYQASVLADLTK